MSTNPTNKFTQPDFTSQDAATYKANLDGAANVMQQIGAAFAPSAQDTPDMTVLLHAGNLFVAGALVEVAEQSTGTITAPSSNNRIDLVYIDMTTGAVGVATGVEDAVPSAPVVPSGKLPVATVSLATSTTAIQDTAITDVRIALYAPDLGTAAYGDIGTDVLAPDGDASDLTNVPGDVITTRGDMIVGDSSGDPTRLAIGTAGQVLTSDGTDVSYETPAVPKIVREFITASQTWTIPAANFNVWCVGKGGDGGVGNNSTTIGGGGGGGGSAYKAYTGQTVGGSKTITVSSGVYTFDTVTANPGTNGGANTDYTQSAAGGTATGGDLNFTGQPGGRIHISYGQMGGGGDSFGPYGGRGAEALPKEMLPGLDGVGYGAGGGGGANNSGGAGQDGIIVIEYVVAA